MPQLKIFPHEGTRRTMFKVFQFEPFVSFVPPW
jgi:hypothetical protein